MAARKTRKDSYSDSSKDNNKETKGNLADAPLHTHGLEHLQGLADASSSVSRITVMQSKADQSASKQVPHQPNRTGMPDSLKSGVEQISGLSMEDVRVHYNSDRPAQLQAKAFAQGSNIHVAPGQEKHLAHEAWHVVQQKQGRVVPTKTNHQGVNINDNPALETEADEMGARAQTVVQNQDVPDHSQSHGVAGAAGEVAQLVASEVMVIKKTRLRKDEGGKPKKGMFSQANQLHAGDALRVDKKEANFLQITSPNSLKDLWVAKTSTSDFEQEKEPKLMDDIGEGLGLVGIGNNAADGIQAGIEKDHLKTKDSEGNIVDKTVKPDGALAAKNNLDAATGGIAAAENLWGMVLGIKKISTVKLDNWQKGEEVFKIVENASGVSANVAKSVDGAAKANGQANGTAGGSDSAAKITEIIDNAIGAVKYGFLGLLGAMRLFSASNKSSTKGKDAAEATLNVTKAAQKGVSVAKTAYDQFNNGAIPGGVWTAVPGLSLAVNIIDMMIMFHQAWESGGNMAKMTEKSDESRESFYSQLTSKSDADYEGDLGKKIFRKENRGVFPSYKNYWRVLPGLLEKLDNSYHEGDMERISIGQFRHGNIDALPPQHEVRIKATQQHQNEADLAEKQRNQATAKTNLDGAKREQASRTADADTAAQVYDESVTSPSVSMESVKENYDNMKATSSAQGESDAHVSRRTTELQGQDQAVRDQEATNQSFSRELEERAEQIPAEVAMAALPAGLDSSTTQVHRAADLPKLLHAKRTGHDYQLFDKLSEINHKRRTKGYSEVFKDMVKIASNIATLSGVGALVGAAMSAGVAGVELAHSGSKFIQGHLRNRAKGENLDGLKNTGEGVDKSRAMKEKEYRQHVGTIFSRMHAAKKKEDVSASTMAILNATGVNTGKLFSLNGDPDAQFQLLVAALKKR